jgi:Flp pilus assembly protein TadG
MARSVHDRANRPRRRALFRRADGGAVSVEFALLIAPFLMLLMGLLELGYMVQAESSLQFATDTASRLIRTGKVTTRSGETLMTSDQLIEELCGKAPIIPDCAEHLSLHVTSADSFTALSKDVETPSKIGPEKLGGTPSIEFSPGGASKATLVVATYDWSLIIPLTKTLGSKRRLVATAVFRNEPF